MPQFLPCANIYLKDLPDLYIAWDYTVNAFAVGSEKPMIILNSGAIDLLSREELLYVIGHGTSNLGLNWENRIININFIIYTLDIL